MSEAEIMAGGQPISDDRLVTLANWQDPPANRWSFQHVRELVPTAVVRHDPVTTWQLARDERDLSAFTFVSGTREWRLKEFLDASETDGFIVLHRGQIIWEHYDNELTPGTKHLCQSVSKSITGAVAGRLVGRRILDGATRLEVVLPELIGTSFEGATVQQLLDMTTGTRFSEDYDDPTADVRVFEQVYLWRPRTDDHLPPDAISYFTGLVNDGVHGTEFRYRSVLTDMMAWVIERASGERFHEVVARELWQPMGAEFDAEVTVDAQGNAMADGGFCATLRDLARVGLLYLDGGLREGNEVLPASWVADTIQGTPESRSVFEHSPEARHFPPDAHYRNFWWVYNRTEPLFYAAGIYGQNIFVHRPSETVVVKLSTWPSPLDEAKLTGARDATVALGEHLTRERALSR